MIKRKGVDRKKNARLKKAVRESREEKRREKRVQILLRLKRGNA